MEKFSFQEVVMEKFASIEEKLDLVRTTDLPEIRQDISLLKYKNRLQGAIAGTVSSLILTVIVKLIWHV